MLNINNELNSLNTQDPLNASEISDSQFEERLKNLESKIQKLKKKNKTFNEPDEEEDDVHEEKKLPPISRRIALLFGTFGVTIGIAAFANNVVLTAIAAQISGSTVKSLMRTIPIHNQVIILAFFTVAAFASDYFLNKYTSLPNLQLSTIALATDIGVLNRKIKLWILGKNKDENGGLTSHIKENFTRLKNKAHLLCCDRQNKEDNNHAPLVKEMLV